MVLDEKTATPDGTASLRRYKCNNTSVYNVVVCYIRTNGTANVKIVFYCPVQKQGVATL